MRRAVARGRLFPQSYSTDRRYGRLSLKAGFLYPMMWSNADDQGRLSGDPEEIKYAVCPNIDHITKADIPDLLKELEKNRLVKVYETRESTAIQLLDWWEVHRPQWAYPSPYPPLEGWKDRLRYHPTPTEIVTENWVPPSQFERELPSPLPSKPKWGLGKELPSNAAPPPEEEYQKQRTKKKREEGEVKVRSPLRSDSTPTPVTSLFQNLVDAHNKGWGRMPDSRETAQLRDLAEELSDAGRLPTEVQIWDVFKEGATHNKCHISYIAEILRKWLGVDRNRSP